MKITRKICLLLVAFVVSQAMAAQSVLTGKVEDKASGEPLAGASVFVQNKDERTLASVLVDANGEYRIRIPEGDNLVIKFSFIGMQSQDVKYTGQKILNIALVEESHELETVEVSAKRAERNQMGLTPREELGAVQRMSMEGLETAPVTSVAEALQGALSNVDIVTGADPGSNSTIRIRGTQSLNASSDPLIVVNGVPFPVNTDDFDFASASTDDYSQLLDISPADIESIEVLKDAQATSIWGSKGANGVLVINTKKGAKGKISFTFSTNAEVKKEASTYPLLNASQYVSLLQDALWNSINDLGYTDSNAQLYMELLDADEINFNPGSLLFNEYNVDTKWLDEVSRIGYTVDNNFSMSGGGDKATYRLSLGYLNEKGTTRGTGVQRFSTRFNMNYRFSKKLDITTEFSFTYNDRNSNWSEGSIEGARSMAMKKMPQESPYVMTEDGTRRTSSYFTPYEDFQQTFEANNNYNPVALVNEGVNKLHSYNTRLSFNLHYQIIPALNYYGTVALTADSKRTKKFLPVSVSGVPWVQDANNAQNPNAWYNRSSDASNEQLYLYTENRLVYNQTFNDIHRIVASGTLQIEQTSATSYGAQTAGNASYYLSDPATGGYLVGLSSGKSTTREMSANVSAQYILMDRYMFNASFRGEATSSLPAQSRWGKFPTFGIGWQLGDEEFMQNQDIISLCKIRLSWGQTGKSPSGVSPYVGTFKADNNGYLDMPSIYPETIELDNVTYEVVDKWNAGIDLGLLDDRLMFTVDLYKNVTNNLLQKGMSLPTSTGFPKVAWYNSGKMTNKGWEFRIDADVVKTKNWNFFLSFNISQNDNMINSFPPNVDMENYTFDNGKYAFLVMEGNPLGSFYGYRYKGVYQNVEDTYAKDVNGKTIYDINGKPVITRINTWTARPGDAKYEDINGDGVINANDIVYLGNYSPKLLGGIQFRLSYKTWQLSANFQGRVGQKVFNQARLNSEMMRGKNNQSTATLRRWRNEGDITDMPRALYGQGYNSLGSDRYIEDASFLRMKTLTLKYGFPRDLLKKMHLKGFDIYITAYDLLTLTKYSGQDPEVSEKKQDDSGLVRLAVDGASTPKPIRVKFGINLRF